MNLGYKPRSEVQEFLSSLERWVKMQERVLETFRESKERVDNADRLEIIHAIRIAFNHMIRTLKAFDQWLQDPFITSHIPREMLLEVWNKTYKILEELLELDIKHTSDVMEVIYKASREGTLNPITSRLREAASTEERPPRGGPTLSI